LARPTQTAFLLCNLSRHVFFLVQAWFGRWGGNGLKRGTC